MKNQKNVVLPYTLLMNFLLGQLFAAGIESPCDMELAGVETDGERTWFQCRSAEWPANRVGRAVPVLYEK